MGSSCFKQGQFQVPLQARFIVCSAYSYFNFVSFLAASNSSTADFLQKRNIQQSCKFIYLSHVIQCCEIQVFHSLIHYLFIVIFRTTTYNFLNFLWLLASAFHFSVFVCLHSALHFTVTHYICSLTETMSSKFREASKIRREQIWRF